MALPYLSYLFYGSESKLSVLLFKNGKEVHIILICFIFWLHGIEPHISINVSICRLWLSFVAFATMDFPFFNHLERQIHGIRGGEPFNLDNPV